MTLTASKFDGYVMFPGRRKMRTGRSEGSSLQLPTTRDPLRFQLAQARNDLFRDFETSVPGNEVPRLPITSFNPPSEDRLLSTSLPRPPLGSPRSSIGSHCEPSLTSSVYSAGTSRAGDGEDAAGLRLDRQSLRSTSLFEPNERRSHA